MRPKILWDKFTDKYSSLIFHPQYFIKKYSNNSIKLAIKYAKGTLLDVGCGRMPYKNMFLLSVNKYIGLDHPEVAKLYKGEEKPDILADATKIPLSDSSSDTITCFQVLEHLPEPQEALKEIARVLKPGGKLILSTVQAYPLHDEPHDYYRYTKYALKNLLKNVHLKVIKVETEGNIFTLIFQSFNIYLMLILKRMINKKNTKPIAIFLIPFFLSITTLTNLITLPLLSIDKNSKFSTNLTIVAKKAV